MGDQPPEMNGFVNYLTEQERARMLRNSMEHRQFIKKVARHCRWTAQVIKFRADALTDEKEPLVALPQSYEEALERARKVAMEARTPGSKSVPVLPSATAVKLTIKTSNLPSCSPKVRARRA